MSTTPTPSTADALAALTAGLTEEKINAMLQVIIYAWALDLSEFMFKLNLHSELLFYKSKELKRMETMSFLS